MCNRKYNENAYTRHIPHCEKKQKDFQKKGNKGNTGGSTKPNLNVKFNNR